LGDPVETRTKNGVSHDERASSSGAMYTLRHIQRV
jgi:hypothetical protein